jgi:aryl-alcohol dehydrogenase-like predicted oxidoreductase
MGTDEGSAGNHNCTGAGASRVEQLTDTLAAADCKLDSALKTRLDEVSIEFRRGDAGK